MRHTHAAIGVSKNRRTLIVCGIDKFEPKSSEDKFDHDTEPRQANIIHLKSASWIKYSDIEMLPRY